MATEERPQEPHGNLRFLVDLEQEMLFDLERQMGSRLLFLDRDKRPAVTPSGEPLRLKHLWAAATAGAGQTNVLHPHIVMSFLMAKTAQRGESPTTQNDAMALSVMMTIAMGIGGYLAKRGIRPTCEQFSLTEAAIAEIMKRLGDA